MVSDEHLWQVDYRRQQFRTVFFAELGTLPSYFVLPKAPYDTNLLLEGGEALMPPELASKVPEAVFDVKEAGKALAYELGTSCGFHMFRVLEPNPKRVEQFQQVVIQFGCETERRSRWPGLKLPAASMRDVDVAIQVI